MTIALSPSQQAAFDSLSAALADNFLLVLAGGPGMGKTTVLRALHARVGGAYLTIRDFLDTLQTRHPLAIEETFDQRLRAALETHDHVFVDDLNLLTDVVANGCGTYPRQGLLDAPLSACAAYANDAGKKLIFGHHSQPPTPIHLRCLQFGIYTFQPSDYEFLCRAYLGDDLAGRLDFAKVHRFAPHLNAHLFRAVCPRLRSRPDLDTAGFIEYLRSFGLASNVDLNEVQPYELSDLKGVADVVRSLEDNIILPLENDELATELGLKPKRGVLLLGPPGTGKTTVGRALAHRLRGKFFLVDGTCIAGTNQFYYNVTSIFEMAKNNAPAVLFIDDSDAIFESGQELGLYRYLLTMLDGLESASAGRVCVMLTAMEIGHLPPALLRSGRIELWLEMRLPDAPARMEILSAYMRGLPAYLGVPDYPRLAGATDGFTGADLRRLAEDGKLLLARDKARNEPLRPLTEYFLEAIAGVVANKQRYAQADARAREQRPLRGPHYDHVGAMRGME